MANMDKSMPNIMEVACEGIERALNIHFREPDNSSIGAEFMEACSINLNMPKDKEDICILIGDEMIVTLFRPIMSDKWMVLNSMTK